MKTLEKDLCYRIPVLSKKQPKNLDLSEATIASSLALLKEHLNFKAHRPHSGKVQNQRKNQRKETKIHSDQEKYSSLVRSNPCYQKPGKTLHDLSPWELGYGEKTTKKLNAVWWKENKNIICTRASHIDIFHNYLY